MSIGIASEIERHLAALANEARAAEGLAPLKVEAHLNASAQGHSDWMAGTGSFSHTGEGGSTALERIEEAGFPLTGAWQVAENLAWTSLTGALDEEEAVRMHEGLMGSPEHRANILDPDLAYVGIGLSVGDAPQDPDRDVVFLTQKFGATDGEVLVQKEVGGGTVLQPHQDGEPVGAPWPVEAPAAEEEVGADAPPDDEVRREEEATAASGSGCFVATAAYGDPLHPDVVELRRFRDEVLVRRAVGRALVRAYGIVGPRAARVVAPDRASGRAAQALIAPLVRLVRGRGRG